MLVSMTLTLLVKNPKKTDESHQVDVEKKLAEAVNTQVKKMVAAAGYGFVGGGLDIRWASKDEAIRYVPRKKHLRNEETGEHVCTTPWVSKKHLVDDPKLVTCKLCLKEMTPKGEACEDCGHFDVMPGASCNMCGKERPF